VDLVELMIDANPDALFEQDEEGLTPLHLTILYGGDEQTVLLLIRRGGKMAASVLSPQVGSALHLACRHTTSLSILEALVRANNDMATTPSENGARPAEVIWRQFLRQHQHNFQIFDAVVHADDNGNDVRVDHPAFRDLVDRIKIIFLATRGEGCSDRQQHYELQIHDLVSDLSLLGDISPFWDIAVRLYPDQVSTTDSQGNFPLHLVARNPRTGLTSDQRFRPTSSFVPRDPIEVLATSYPIAASIPDQRGDLPLHLALKCGQRKWGEGLSSLVQAFPCALEQRDRETGLFPFQLPAVFLVGNELESLGTIYELLVSCPHVIRMGD